MSKIKSRKDKKAKLKLHWVHLFAVLILGGYFILSKINTVHAISKSNTIESFIQLYTFGAVFACLFLYLFSHERFFPVAREIEKDEEKKEKKYLSKYIHHGKVFATFLVGVIGGPVFSSLTARLLINNLWYKYIIVVVSNIPSTILTFSIGRGVIQLVLK